MNLLIEVEYTDYDQDQTTEHYGPFRTEKAARAFLDSIGYALRTEINPRGAYLHYTHSNAEGIVTVMIRPLNPPKVRPLVANVKEFIAGLLEEGIR